MNLFKNKKGSGLVEKILVAAFAVSMGGAVILYGSNVISQSKNADVESEIRTYKFNQITRISSRSNSVLHGITLNATNTEITFNGTGTIEGGNNAGFANGHKFNVNHKYLLSFFVDGSVSEDIRVSYQYRIVQRVPAGTYSHQRFAMIGHHPEDYGSNAQTFCITRFGNTSQTYVDFKISNYMIIDLTEMYGSGDEPTSVESFTKVFPKEYYSYHPESAELSKAEINNL